MAGSNFLIAGLGNPGATYAPTRHNLGFRFVDRFAKENGWRMQQSRMQGIYCKERFGGLPVVLVKPQTFMNRSGECVRQFMDFFKVDISRLLVLHDDLDLVSGKIRVVARGGAGGHNGIRSLIQHLGTAEFARLKIGIGRPTDHGLAGMPVDRFVLAPLTAAEEELFSRQAELALEAVELFMTKGIEACMNRINGR